MAKYWVLYRERAKSADDFKEVEAQSYSEIVTSFKKDKLEVCKVIRQIDLDSWEPGTFTKIIAGKNGVKIKKKFGYHKQIESLKYSISLSMIHLKFEFSEICQHEDMFSELFADAHNTPDNLRIIEAISGILNQE